MAHNYGEGVALIQEAKTGSEKTSRQNTIREVEQRKTIEA
jgi:hypothetical protein